MTTDAEELLHARFEHQARLTPDRVALFEEERTITFAELAARSRRVAEVLRAEGVSEDSVVGLHLNRSIEWVVATLGVLRAGAALLPLPPGYPSERKRQILDFAVPDWVVESEATRLEIPFAGGVGRLERIEASEAPEVPDAIVAPSHPALVLASSGSTGRPKLIVRSHESFFHRLLWTWTTHPFERGEIGCQKAHMTTTHLVYELFEPLLAGAPVLIVSDEGARDLEGFWTTIRDRGVTRLLMVPSALEASMAMPDFAAPDLRVLVLMGEYVSPALARRALEAFSDASVYSIYGSTEASSTILCDLRKELGSGEELPLGHPISSRVRALVLGEEGRPVQPGEVGRLHIAGSSLFSGYLGDELGTEEVLRGGDEEGGLLYDTRDQVRVEADGSLVFAGRVDHAVKVRGFRVDLMEVEGALRRCAGVSQAAVVLRDRGTPRAALVGFYAPKDLDRAALFDALRAELAEYMVPSTLTGLDQLPLTHSHKIDRVRLAEEFDGREAEFSSSDDLPEDQGRVFARWEEVLGHRGFDTRSSFFEVGGSSLVVFELVEALRAEFALDRDQLGAEAVYRAPSIREQAAMVDRIRSGAVEPSVSSQPILVPLRQWSGEGPQEPLFVIASAGGTLGAYDRLVRALPPGRPVLGVRDPFLWGERDPTRGFSQWIDLYLGAIQERQPSGPYYLCAYSSAGAFGYELAQRLTEQGHHVALLALIDALGLDRSDRFGSLAFRATWMRSQFRPFVRLAGWIRMPFVRASGRADRHGPTPGFVPSAEELEAMRSAKLLDRGHIVTMSTLMELNSGRPFALAHEDLAEVPAERYLDVLLDRVREVAPEVDPEMIERLVVQYSLQVRSHQEYALQRYEGDVLLIEAGTAYAGLLGLVLRPYLPRLTATAFPLGAPSQADLEVFGAHWGHYRSMRDDGFVQAAAEKLGRAIVEAGGAGE